MLIPHVQFHTCHVTDVTLHDTVPIDFLSRSEGGPISSPLRALRTDILTLGAVIRRNFRGLSTIRDCSLNSNNDSHLKSKVIASVVHVSCD